MELIVTPSALSCFKGEWGIGIDETIRVFVRYVSGGEVPFAFGITRDTPLDAAVTTVADRITFYMESKDVWFLEGKSLKIDCLDEEIVFHFA
ncbi:HesB/YadR/YfhF family protein [Cohnella cholangitidis]|uniref:Fe-S cluster assembly protein HesB n=1 Tax=Cohnella cholangitidis TaxID=2598458 RepID=A0A7G5C2L1_9BACL|nr:Fe-S cluster assembly protein HesB [Cohnella cholangitidis]QMV43445.1 Fe-S cluster assembly protein HesB [Cohnella cholangitidis]